MAQIDDLKNKICKATLATIEGIILETYAFCKTGRNKGQAESILKSEIHPLLLKDMPSELHELIHKGPASTETISDGEMLLKSVPMQKQIAVEVLEPHFKKVYDEHQGVVMCEVINTEYQILKPIRNTALAENRMKSYLHQNIESKFEAVHSSVISEMVKQWDYSTESISRPAPMLKKGEPGWCYHRPLIDIKEGEYPCWQSILDRLTDPDAFCAWIWGVYSGDYKGRKTLWITGEGEIGKSATARAIGDFFGNAYTAIDNAQMKGNNSFLLSGFVDARLIVYPDANNTMILLSELFKSICSAGADKVAIQFKGKDTYYDFLNAYALIISNQHPFVTKDSSLVSRLLYMQMVPFSGPPDATAPVRIKSEAPFFLHHAKECYERLCPDNYTIQTLKETTLLMEEVQVDCYEEYHTIFESNFITTGLDTDSVTGSEMRSILSAEGLKDTRKQADYHKWLLAAYAVKKVRAAKLQTWIYTGLKLGKTTTATKGSGLESL